MQKLKAAAMEIETPQQSLHILHDLIEELTLPQLPVKSLLRFRCVSRRWRSLIDSKQFIKKHYQNSLKDSSLARHRLFSISAPPLMMDIAQSSLLSLLDTPPVFHSLAESKNFPTLTIHPSLITSISSVGTCNGLICVLLSTRLRNQQFIVWNPCTRVSRTVEYLSRGITNYGFYWDEATDDYKVIVNEGRVSLCKVYSLRKDSWKEIRAPALSLLEQWGRAGILAGGRLHWPAPGSSESESPLDIIAFDLKSEAFETVEQPPCTGRYQWLGLGSIRECLSVQRMHGDRIDGDRFEVWVMKEYGVKESWEVLFFFNGPFVFSPNVDRFCMGKEGEILLIKLWKIVIYDRKRGDLVESCNKFIEAEFYVESLASPLDVKSKPFVPGLSLPPRLFSHVV